MAAWPPGSWQAMLFKNDRNSPGHGPDKINLMNKAAIDEMESVFKSIDFKSMLRV
jgi:hypothetical protein